MNPYDNLIDILSAYTSISGREARLPIYEHSLFDWVKAGFTKSDMIIVLNFIIRENRKNDYKYSLRLGPLINDLQRFSDLLEEAKAKERNRKVAPTAKERVLKEFRGVEHEPAANVRNIGEIFKGMANV